MFDERFCARCRTPKTSETWLCSKCRLRENDVDDTPGDDMGDKPKRLADVRTIADFDAVVGPRPMAEIPEADVMLGLSMKDWEWLLNCLASRYYLAHSSEDDRREAWLVGLLSGQWGRQRAALEKTENTAGAPT